MRFSCEPVIPTSTADLPAFNSVAHSRVEGANDFFDHTPVQMPDDGDGVPLLSTARSTTNSSDQSPTSRKKPPPTPKKPAHLRKDSVDTSLLPSPSSTSPKSSYVEVSGLGSNPVSISSSQSSRKRPAKPIKHEGISGLAPLPDWAQTTPRGETSGSTWKGK